MNFDTTKIGGRRTIHGDVIAWIDDGVEFKALPHRKHHSPDGFEMGYDGSGPADLALSICEWVVQADPEKTFPKTKKIALWRGSCTETAWLAHHHFKREFVAGWQNEFSIEAPAVLAYLRALMELINSNEMEWAE